MPATTIHFHYEGIAWRLPLPQEVSAWLLLVAKQQGARIEALNYVFATDEYVLGLNKTHLQHDYYTDILTFDLGAGQGQPLMGDIFISIERVQDNAKELGLAFVDELHRVMVHGLLHLLGYEDQTDDLAQIMRQQEDHALNLRMF
jgi:probable rRNA maturation factor